MTTATAERSTSAALIDLQGQIMALIASGGWVPDRLLPFATKEIETAAGQRQASVRLSAVLPCKENPRPFIALSAEYRSEGINAVSAHWAPVYLDAAPGAVASAVASFLVNVQESVDKTFARRLHLARNASEALRGSHGAQAERDGAQWATDRPRAG